MKAIRLSKNIDTDINGIVLVEYDGKREIIIHETPVGINHETYKDAKRLQRTSLMAFQESLSMYFRVQAQSNSISLPLPDGRYQVIIEIQSQRKVSELPLPTINNETTLTPLIDMMKSVLDSINIHVVEDDAQIYEAEIKYHYLSRGTKARPDRIVVKLFDLALMSPAPIIEIEKEIYLVPKERPIYSEGDDKLYTVNSLHYIAIAKGLGGGVQFPVYNQYHVGMKFVGDVKNLDVDNMAKNYFPIVTSLGLESDLIHRITLKKEQSSSNQVVIGILDNTPAQHKGNP